MRLGIKLSLSSKVFIGLALFFIALTFILPASTVTKSTLSISSAQYILLLLIVKIPIVAVWCMMFYSYRRLHNYAELIKDTAEGKHFATISKGLMYIVWGALVPAIIAAFLNAIANNTPGFLMYALVISNYMYLLVTFIGLSYLSAGSHQLALQAKLQPSNNHIRLMILMLVFVGVLFCYLIAERLNGGPTNSYNAYYLPNVAVWITLVMPYLYAWFLGIFAALQLLLVARRTPGVIYKQALGYVAIGLVFMIASMIMLQYIRGVVPRTGSLTVGFALGLVYATYALGGIGALIMAIGARRLKKIEDV